MFRLVQRFSSIQLSPKLAESYQRRREWAQLQSEGQFVGELDVRRFSVHAFSSAKGIQPPFDQMAPPGRPLTRLCRPDCSDGYQSVRI